MDLGWSMRLQYEMLIIYITSKSKIKRNEYSNSPDLQALLKRAMMFLNTTAGTKITFNFPLHAHRTTESFTQWIDIDDDVNFNKFNETVVCLSDDDSDDEDLSKISARFGKEFSPVSPKLNVQDISEASPHVTCCCCPNYDSEFQKCFTGTHFQLISNNEQINPKCPICCDALKNISLNDHVMNCVALKEK